MDRKLSGDDFESVASWVRYKRESLGRGYSISAGFGRVNSSPNIQRLNYRYSSQKPNPLPKPANNALVSASSSANSKPSSFVGLRRSSSFDSSFEKGDRINLEKIVSSIGKGQGKAPGSRDSLVSNDLYEQLDSGNWQSQTFATSGREDQGQPSSLHDYESIKEFGSRGQQMSIESSDDNPDYDYVKSELAMAINNIG